MYNRGGRKMDYPKEILDRYEKQVLLKLKNIDDAIKRKRKVIAPGIVQYNFESFDDMYHNINPLVKPLCLYEYIFRGHSHSTYQLLPTVKRNTICQNRYFRTEFNLLTSFAEKISRRNLPMPSGGQYFLRDCEFLNALIEWIPLEALDFVAYARHAGLSTRLLDWTYDFLTAVYFAASGIIDEVRECIKAEKNTMDCLNDDMVIWLFNIAQWKELTDYMRPINPYGLFESNLHFTMPYYHDNVYAYAQKGLLSYFSVKKEKTVRTSPYEVLADWDNETSKPEDNCTLDDYIAQGYMKLMEANKFLPAIPIMFKFTLPAKEALDTIDSLIHLGYTRSSIYPNAENCAKDVQGEDNFQ